MKLIIAEKPSVARDIARVVKCGERKDGYLQGGDYMVSWALGHLVTLKEPDELDERYTKWRMEDLPIDPETIPTKVIPKTKSQFAVLKKLMHAKEVDSLICATDAGREGELIFRLIYEQAGCKKPVERLWISSMTDEAIREGFAQLRPSADYDGLYRSARARAIADWLIGMNASRAFTIRYHTLLSMGRVQTPTLAILVKRQREIEAFVPVEYYTLTADFGDYQGQWFDPTVQDEKTANRLPDKERAAALAKKVRGQPARVTSVTAEQKRDLPPQLFDLTTLQREANRALGFTADKTLKLAQSLYERWKALTYPRTDSRYLPMDMLKRLPKTFQQLPEEYRPLVQGIPRNENGGLPVSRRVFDNDKVSDHHAILPTLNRAPVDKMSADERALFDMVARRSIAAFYPASEYDLTRVVTEAAGERFRSTGRTERVAGWRAVYRTADGAAGKGAKPAEQPLPDLKQGDARTVEKATTKKESTKPPAPHTDASLLSAMENAGRELDDEALREQMKGSGLGTPATRAAIIERLLQVGYASRKGKTLQATPKGIALIGICPQELASPETTGKWELALNEIAQNKRDTERFMQGIRRLSAFLVDYAKSTTVEGGFPEEPRPGRKRGAVKKQDLLEGVVCPLCGQPVKESEKAFGCSGWQAGCAFSLWKDGLTRGHGPVLTRKLVTLLLQQKRVRGSTGVLSLESDALRFEPADPALPPVSSPIIYRKKA